MTTLSDLNSLMSLGLALLVFGSVFCRFAVIEMRRIQYRYVAPIVMAGLAAVFTIFTLVGGDKADYFMPIALAGFGFSLWNNRRDWENGVPDHMLRVEYRDPALHRRKADVETVPARRRSDRILPTRVQNFLVGMGMAATVGVTGVTAMEGTGQPLHIYSIHPEPRAVTPNGEMNLVFTLRRTRVCSGYVDRFIVRAEGGQIVQRFSPSPIGAFRVGVKSEGVRVPLKLDGIPPGNYVYRSTITHFCEDRAAPYVMTTPDVPFIVVPEIAERS